MKYDLYPMMVNQAMASSANSSVIDLRNTVNLSLQFITTSASSPTGTVAVQFADDCTANVDGSISGGNFGLDASAPAVPVVTSNGTKMWNYTNVGHAFCRVAYTSGTGTGNLSVNGLSKGV